jgi:hypothetical protein
MRPTSSHTTPQPSDPWFKVLFLGQCRIGPGLFDV